MTYLQEVRKSWCLTKMKANIVKLWLPIVALIIAIIGFADALYLTVEHFSGGSPTCSIIEGCDIVTTSVYSEVIGIPVALGGVIYYLLVAVGLITYLDRRSTRGLKIASSLPMLGFLGSLYFVYLQLFVLHAICIYCMGSAITSTLLMILGITMLAQMKKVTSDVMKENDRVGRNE